MLQRNCWVEVPEEFARQVKVVEESAKQVEVAQESSVRSKLQKLLEGLGLGGPWSRVNVLGIHQLKIL